MSNPNPYRPTSATRPEPSSIRRVSIRPIELLKRSYDLMGDQYWLFLGMTIVGMIIGSAVPMGLIMGPIIVGLYLCFIEREQGRRVEFSTMFRGFDYFLESFLVMLFYLIATAMVIVPFMLIVFAVILLPVLTASGGGNPPPQPQIRMALLVIYPVVILLNMVLAMPLMFAFQLIADRNLTALPALKTSLRGVFVNLGGIIWFMVVMTFISILATLMCYIPALLLMPISIGALFLLYRDVYGGEESGVRNQASGTRGAELLTPDS